MVESVETPQIEETPMAAQEETPMTVQEAMRPLPELPKIPEKKLSPMLSKEEQQMAKNLGQSLDSKKISSALGYLDLK